MRRPGGYLRISDPDLGIAEFDTFTCAHCQRVTIVRTVTALGGYCRLCDRLVCSRCAGGDCTPFLKKLEAIEARDYRIRQWRLLL